MADLNYDDLAAVPVVLACLRESTHLAGNGITAAHVSGLREAPFPHVQVEPATTTFGDPASSPMLDEVTVTVWAHPDGQPGRSALQRLARIVAGELLLLAEDDSPHTRGAPVVSRVIIQSGPNLQTPTSGQTRAVLTAALTLRPTPAP